MRKLAKLYVFVLMSLTLLPQLALAAGSAAAVVIVADTRKTLGWEAWFANLYNESHLYFTLLTIVLIPLIGVSFGLIADVIMKHIGINLDSRELAEH
jgi:hypothetical protein